MIEFKTESIIFKVGKTNIFTFCLSFFVRNKTQAKHFCFVASELRSIDIILDYSSSIFDQRPTAYTTRKLHLSFKSYSIIVSFVDSLSSYQRPCSFSRVSKIYLSVRARTRIPARQISLSVPRCLSACLSPYPFSIALVSPGSLCCSLKSRECIHREKCRINRVVEGNETTPARFHDS